jgi:phosphatidylethanolamine-binding protein (PEBP) family uncharacterized protein
MEDAMGRRMQKTGMAILTLSLAIAGCGGSGSKSSAGQASASATGPTSTSGSGSTGATGASAASEKQGPSFDLKVSSSAFREGKPISAHYTCDGANVSPPLRWTPIPAGTAELVLTIGNLETGTHEGLISWAVAGLSPKLTGLAAGKLPAGAIVGRNHQGQTRYSICPAKGAPRQNYLVALYALRRTVPAKPGFNGEAFVQQIEKVAEHKGLAGFTYKR